MSVTETEPIRQAVSACAAALKRISHWQLAPALDQRMLELGERKDRLSETERAELLALVEFTRQRSLEKLEAELALQRLAAAWPNGAA